jgi:hypothetical protein
VLVISHVSTILAGEILSLTWSQEKLLLVGLCCSMFVPWSNIHNTIQLLVNLWNESTCIPSLRGPLASMALFNDCEKSYLWHIYIYIHHYTPILPLYCLVFYVAMFTCSNMSNIESLANHGLFYPCIGHLCSTGWWFGTMEFYDFPIHVGMDCHQTNWRSHIVFFREVENGRSTNHQAVNPCYL